MPQGPTVRAPHESEQMDRLEDERRRILEVYEARDRRVETRFFAYRDPVHVWSHHERYRGTLLLLASAGFHPLSDVRILDVGCGDGGMLRQFLQWGGAVENLAGIELRPDAVRRARHLSPNFDIREGSATLLPWPDRSFDLVCQHTVFTSVLASEMKRRIASEMTRVLRNRGAVLWYDFRYNNPRNPDVRGVAAKEVRALFPDLEIRLGGITLAPPLARRLPVALLPILYPLLSAFPPLRTHYLGLFTKP